MAKTIEENEINTQFDTEGFSETIDDVTQTAGGVAAIGAAAEYSAESIANLIASLKELTDELPELQTLIKYQDQLRKSGKTETANDIIKNIRSKTAGITVPKDLSDPAVMPFVNAESDLKELLNKYRTQNTSDKTKRTRNKTQKKEKNTVFTPEIQTEIEEANSVSLEKLNDSIFDAVEQLDKTKVSLKNVDKTLDTGAESLNEYLKTADSVTSVTKKQKTKNAEKREKYFSEMEDTKSNIKNGRGFVNYYKKYIDNDSYNNFDTSLSAIEKRFLARTNKGGKIKFNDNSIFNTTNSDVEIVKKAAWNKTKFDQSLLLPNLEKFTVPKDVSNFINKFVEKNANMANFKTTKVYSSFEGTRRKQLNKDEVGEGRSLERRTPVTSPDMYNQSNVDLYMKEITPRIFGEFTSGWKKGEKGEGATRLKSKEVQQSIQKLIEDFYTFYAKGLSEGLNENDLLSNYLESDKYQQLRSEYSEKYYLAGEENFERAKKLGTKNAMYDNPKTASKLGGGILGTHSVEKRIADALAYAEEGGFEKEDYYRRNYWKNVENIKKPLFQNSEEDEILSHFLAASPYKNLEYSYANYNQNKLAEQYNLKKANMLGAADFGIMGVSPYNSVALNGTSYIESFKNSFADEKQQIKIENSKEVQDFKYEKNLDKLQDMLQDEIKLREQYKEQLEQAEAEAKGLGLGLDEAREYIYPFAKQLKEAEGSIRETNLNIMHLQNAREKALKNNKNRFGTTLKESAFAGIDRWSKSFSERGGFIGGVSKAGQNFFKDKSLGHFGGKKIDGKWTGGINIGGGVVGFAVEAFKKLGAAIKKLATQSLEAFKEIQTTKTNLGVVYGTQSESDAVFNQIANYATQSPFGVKQTADFAVLLKQSGVKDIDLMNTLKQIADTAGGSSEKYSRIANNFAQIVAQGKATSIDLRQFANAGIPIYELLKKQLGNVSVAEIRQKTEKGEITSDLIEKVFADATSKGGVFYKAVEQGAATYSARLQNMQDIKQLNLAKVGEMLYSLGDNKTRADDGILKSILHIQEELYTVVGNIAESVIDNKNENNAKSKEQQVEGYYDQIDRFYAKLNQGGNSKEQEKFYKTQIKKLQQRIEESYSLMPEDTIRSNRNKTYTDKYEKAKENYKEYKEVQDYKRGLAATLGTAGAYDISSNNSDLAYYNSLSPAEKREYDINKVFIKIRDFSPLLQQEVYKNNDNSKLAIDLLRQIGELTDKMTTGDYDYGEVFTVAEDISKKASAIVAETDKEKDLTLKDYIKRAKITDEEFIAHYQTQGNTLGKYQIQKVEKKEKLPDSAYSLSAFARQRYEQSDTFKAKQAQEEQEKIEKVKKIYDNQHKYNMSSENDWINGVTPEQYADFINQNYFTLRDLKVATQEDIRKGGYEKNSDLISTIDNINAFKGGIKDLLTKSSLESPVMSYLEEFLSDFDKLKNANTYTEKNKITNEISQIKGKVFEWLTDDLETEIQEKIALAEESGDTNLVDKLKAEKETLVTYISAVFQGRELNEITDEMIQNIHNEVLPFWKRLSSSLLSIPQDIIKLLPDFKSTVKFWKNSNIRQQNEAIGKSLLSSGTSFSNFTQQVAFRNSTTGTGANQTRSVDQARTSANLLFLAESINSEVEVTQTYANNLATQVDQLRTLISAGVFRMEDSQMITDADKAAALGYKKDDINELARLINAFSVKDDKDHSLTTLQLIYNELVKQSQSLSIIASVKSFTKNQKNSRSSDKGEFELYSNTNAAKFNIDFEKYKTSMESLAETMKQAGDTRPIDEIIKELINIKSISDIQAKIKEANDINAKNAGIRAANASAQNAYDTKLKAYEESVEAEKDLKPFREAYNKGDYTKKFKSSLYKNNDGTDEFTALEYVDKYVSPDQKFSITVPIENSNGLTTEVTKVKENIQNAKPAEPSLKSEVTTPTEGAVASAVDETLKEPVFKTFAQENSNLYNTQGKYFDEDFGSEFLNILKQNKDPRISWAKEDLLNIPQPEPKLSPLDAFDVMNLRGNKSANGEEDLTLYGKNTLSQQRSLDWFSKNGYESMGSESMKNAAYNIQAQVASEGDDVTKSQFYKNMKSKMSEVGGLNGLSKEEMTGQLSSLEDALKLGDTSALEKWIEQFGKMGNSADFIKGKFKELSSDIKSTAKSQALSAMNESFAQIGKNIAAGESASDGLYNIWKNMASTIMSSIGASMTSAGFDLISYGARENKKDMITKGLLLAAAGGVAGIAGGILGYSDDSDTDNDDAEAQRIQNLKDALADLIDQAKTDAEYYQTNLMHKNALATNETISTRNYSVNDAIITPNGNVVSTHPDDYLIATKTPEQFIGGSSSGGVNLQVNAIVNNNSANVTATTETKKNEDGSIDIITTIYDVVNNGLAEGKFDDGLASYDYRQQGRSVAS